MIALKYKKVDKTKLDKQIASNKEMLHAMWEAYNSQKNSKLGNSFHACTALREKVEEAELLKSLSENFRLIEKPNVATYATQGYHNSLCTHLSGKTPWFSLPKVAMVKLDPEATKIQQEFGDKTFSANIPVIPTSVQALAVKARGVCKDMIFWMLFLPAWDKGIQKDPYLLGQVGDNWVEIGWWGGDKDLLKQYIKEKK